MELYHIFSLLDTASVIQGLILGICLILLHKKKYKSTLIIGVFLIMYVLQRIPLILHNVRAFESYPELFRLPFNFLWLLFPTFFIYIQKISIFSHLKIKYWVLYPGIIAFLIQLVIFLLPYQTKLEFTESIWFNTFFFLGAVYSWVIAVWNLNFITQHKIEVNNQFSMATFKELQWARTFLIVGLIGAIAYVLLYLFIQENLYSRIYYLIYDLVIIYWLSYHAIKQRNVISILGSQAANDFIEKKIVHTDKTPSSTKENLEELMNKIDDYITKSDSYEKTELTIVDVSNELSIHTKQISTAINTIRNQNFNTYINQFRIEKAISLLGQQDILLSIEGIGHEVGFHSKSAFYTAFKKVTGTTPTKFKENKVA